MRWLAIFAGVSVSLACAGVAHANPLKELVSSRGTSTIKYERAVGKRAEFTQLAAEGPVAGVAVTLVDDGGTGAGDKVADAYVAGLRTVMPNSQRLAASDERSPQYVARIALARTEGHAGEDAKLIMAAQGTTCQQVGKEKMQCQEVGPAPNAMGKTKGTWVNPELTVMIRLYRFDTEDRAAAPSVVFEDTYTLSYIETECTDPGAAAASVARLLGESATTSRAFNLDFPTTPRVLGCNTKG